jgi:phage tail sheath gpL-like
MTTIAVSGFASSTKTPRMYFAVVLGGPGTSAGVAQKTIILYGTMNDSGLSGATPNFTTAAGTATVANVYLVTDSDTAATLFGMGSELHQMVKFVFAQSKLATLYCIPVTEPVGVRATVVLTVSVSSQTAMDFNLFFGGQMITASADSDDTATDLATKIASAVVAKTDLPCTAQYAAGVITFRYKHYGTRGNLLPIRVEMKSSGQTVTLRGGALTATVNGVTATLSGGTAVGNNYMFSLGTGSDDITNALAVTVSGLYDRHVLAQIDTSGASSNGRLLASQLDSMAAVGTGIWQQGVMASVDTYANAVTAAATNLNKSRMQMVWHYNGEGMPGWIAAQVATARLFGDGVCGGNTIGEATDPATNLNGCMLASTVQQAHPADRPTGQEIENALNNGLTVLAPTPANPGFVGIVASITTRCLDASSPPQPNFAVWKTKVVTVSDFVAYDIRSDLASTYAGFKLRPNTSDGSPIKIARTATPLDVKGRIITKLKQYEENGILMNVDDHIEEVAVMLDPAWPSRVLADIPEVPISDFDQVAGNIRQLSF